MSFRTTIYKIFPKKWRHTLGSAKILKPFRDLLFRKAGRYREETVFVKRNYSGFDVAFHFVASLQIATKAVDRGMENTLINNAITLLKKYKQRPDNSYIIFDVGANFGYLSLVWKHTIAKNGFVYAFEPHPMIVKSIQSSVALNKLKNFNVIHKAVSNVAGNIMLHLSPTTSNTLNEVAQENNANETVTIDMVTLDEFITENKINEVDLIKIDVDGIEHDILKGAKNTIANHRPIVVVETNGDPEIHTFLRAHSYKILDMQLKECLDDTNLPVNSFGIPQ